MMNRKTASMRLRCAAIIVLGTALHGCSSSGDPPRQAAGFRSFGGTTGEGSNAAPGGAPTTSSVETGSMGLGGTVNSSTTTHTIGSRALGGGTSEATGGTTSGGATIAVGGTTAAIGGTTAAAGSTARISAASGGRAPSGGATSLTGGARAMGGATVIGGSGSTGGGGGVTPAGGSTSDATGGKTSTGGSAQCAATATLKAGDNQRTLQFGGRNRSYVLYVPSSLEAGTAVPLIFDFHGHGGNGVQEQSSSGWMQKADKNGFIVVYPDGVDSSWNVGSCCGQAMSDNVDDVGFTRAILEAVSQATCIDRKRVYATGMSNGAGFTHRLACEAADVIAAIAAASADLVTDPCKPTRPISELSIRGLSDTLVAYEGGNTGSTGWYSPGAEQTLQLWKAIDQCTGPKTVSHQYCEGYTSCNAAVEIALCSLPNTGHDTYNNAVGFDVPDIAWEMFQRQPMP